MPTSPNAFMDSLPLVNACLNGLALVLLVVAVRFVKRGRIDAHKRTMIAAFVVSSVFLVFYLLHKGYKRGAHTPFNARGVILYAYYVMLVTHVALAMAVPVLAIWLIRLGLKRRDEKHRRIARFAYPIWLYVSVTGVVIYVVLYHLNPSAG